NGDSQGEIARGIRGRAVDDHGVGSPGPALREDGHRVEVAEGDEVDVATGGRLGQLGRVVPGGEAELARIGGLREGIVVQAQAAHEGEGGEAAGVTEDLVPAGGGMTAP